MPAFIDSSTDSPARAILRAAALRGALPAGFHLPRATRVITRLAAITAPLSCRPRAAALHLLRSTAARALPRAVAANTRDASARAKLWHLHMARRLRAERRFTGAVQTALDAALDELRRAETPAAGLPPAAENSVLSFLFDLARHTASLVRLTTAAARAALTDAGEQLAEELGQDDPWTMPDEQALAYLRARENKIRAASESIFASIKDEIDTGLREGESPQQLTRRVEDAMPGITREKAETIARTETGAAYGQARQAGLADAGIEFKEWVTARDENVRATHVALDGVIVPLGAKFKVGESWLDFPCDPDGPPGEVINCRCIQVASHGPATKTT